MDVFVFVLSICLLFLCLETWMSALTLIHSCLVCIEYLPLLERNPFILPCVWRAGCLCLCLCLFLCLCLSLSLHRVFAFYSCVWIAGCLCLCLCIEYLPFILVFGELDVCSNSNTQLSRADFCQHHQGQSARWGGITYFHLTFLRFLFKFLKPLFALLSKI